MQLSVYFQSSTGEPEGLFAGWKVSRITPSRMHDGSVLPGSRHTLARPCCLVTEASRIHPCGRQKMNFGKIAGELHHTEHTHTAHTSAERPPLCSSDNDSGPKAFCPCYKQTVNWRGCVNPTRTRDTGDGRRRYHPDPRRGGRDAGRFRGMIS